MASTVVVELDTADIIIEFGDPILVDEDTEEDVEQTIENIEIITPEGNKI